MRYVRDYERDCTITDLYETSGLSLRVIGERFSISRTRVMQIVRRERARRERVERSISLQKRWPKLDQAARLASSIDILGDCSVRVFTVLDSLGTPTIGALLRLTEDDLLRTKNFGRKSLRELKANLKLLGLKLELHGRR